MGAVGSPVPLVRFLGGLTAQSLGLLRLGACKLTVAVPAMSRSVVFSSANNSKLACTKLQAGAQSVHENICRHRARARILRIGICRSEQKRSCATNTADGLSKDRKNLLHKDHRFWHSSAMRTVVRDDVSDHGQPDRGFRARINNLAKK